MKGHRQEDLPRLLRVFRDQHRYPRAELEKLQVALRLYEKPLIDLCFSLIHVQEDTENIVFPLVLASHFRGSSLSQLRQENHTLRQRLADQLVRREALALSPLEDIIG